MSPKKYMFLLFLCPRKNICPLCSYVPKEKYVPLSYLRKGGFTTTAFSLRPRTSMQISVPGLLYAGFT